MRNIRTLVIVMMPMNLHEYILAVDISVIAAIVVPLFMSALCKRSRIAAFYDLLL